MVWEQLTINKPHLAYIIVGGFTSLFMLCSLFVKERLYIGEATVATLCGVIFGPHAANLFNPLTWGNTDQITLECSRIVLVVQCFAVGVELPKAYMERHWKSVILLLIPVMTFGWLVTSLFIWWMIEPLSWLESLCCAACVTATDPVLASSVVGKGKFAKRVPKHLRDLLSAESGCNDGMAFPFIYLALYLIRYRPHAGEVFYYWACLTILYECVFGAIYGFTVGYIGRHAIKWAERNNLVDRESFLVFYFVLALFCAGSGSLLGVDDLLVGFAAGVGFSNDGWFLQKTEESHVSNVIDLLLNLAYFVYLGSIIPWAQYNNPSIGTTPWRLVVIALFVIFFRRIPIMLALKPIIPDVKTWREALFAGHFGPIGVGAIFVAIMARAELESESTTPLAELPPPGSENYVIVQLIWPITTFLVISSILVHGSSIAVFTLGKHINTLTITMSYTQANEDGPSWMNRLPRIQSQSKGSMSKSRLSDVDSSNEKLPEYPPGTLPPIGLPGNFLRRQKEEDNPSRSGSRSSSLRASSRRRKWDAGNGPGGPISRSAIAPQRRMDITSPSGSDTLNEKSDESPEGEQERLAESDGVERAEERDRKEDVDMSHSKTDDKTQPDLEAWEEGDDEVIEDKEGNVLNIEDVRGQSPREKRQHLFDEEEHLNQVRSGESEARYEEQRHLDDEEDSSYFAIRTPKDQFKAREPKEVEPQDDEVSPELGPVGSRTEQVKEGIKDGLEHPSHPYRNLRKRMGRWEGWKRNRDEAGPSEAPPTKPEHKRGPAMAYQMGNTIIVEDEDGEVVKKYDLPKASKKPGQPDRKASYANPRQNLHRMGTWVGVGKNKMPEGGEAGPSGTSEDPTYKKKVKPEDPDDDRLRFTINSGGRRMSKADFIKEIQQLDPKARAEVVEESNAPEAVKKEARRHAKEHRVQEVQKAKEHHGDLSSAMGTLQQGGSGAEVQLVGSKEDRPQGPEGLQLVDSEEREIPYHDLSQDLQRHRGSGETAADRRRREAAARRGPIRAQHAGEDSDDDGTDRVPPRHHQSPPSASTQPQSNTLQRQVSHLATGETAAEKRRREAALGVSESGVESDSDDDNTDRQPPRHDNDNGISGAGGAEGRRQRLVEERRQPGIRFADQPAVSQGRSVQWGEDVGQRRGRRG
ncbi:MAG: hypothetical protein M1827_006348 [Pycnora praestabilis]|nr:MAG: hypothetical protein M1827_006348 [Pycnora praestabilis]